MKRKVFIVCRELFSRVLVCLGARKFPCILNSSTSSGTKNSGDNDRKTSRRQRRIKKSECKEKYSPRASLCVAPSHYLYIRRTKGASL